MVVNRKKSYHSLIIHKYNKHFGILTVDRNDELTAKVTKSTENDHEMLRQMKSNARNDTLIPRQPMDSKPSLLRQTPCRM